MLPIYMYLFCYLLEKPPFSDWCLILDLDFKHKKIYLHIYLELVSFTQFLECKNAKRRVTIYQFELNLKIK